MVRSKGLLKGDDARRGSVGVGNARQAEEFGDVFRIGADDAFELLVPVIRFVGKAQAAWPMYNRIRSGFPASGAG
ncbi:hypothetical protein AHiyo8_04510 [Arthrobacter sp. Hiyo8]|nr:hypothetical protein AHiyo8_04510 [Arthrobacter sp. Hiyo8]